mmetsp:Transcript_2166/g.6298  ORF Transcript_2166/g.6298 Transcript_2166/m.6298 type:complete len:285 (-) Transcript_2166:11-865(-)
MYDAIQFSRGPGKSGKEISSLLLPTAKQRQNPTASTFRPVVVDKSIAFRGSETALVKKFHRHALGPSNMLRSQFGSTAHNRYVRIYNHVINPPCHITLPKTVKIYPLRAWIFRVVHGHLKHVVAENKMILLGGIATKLFILLEDNFRQGLLIFCLARKFQVVTRFPTRNERHAHYLILNVIVIHFVLSQTIRDQFEISFLRRRFDFLISIQPLLDKHIGTNRLIWVVIRIHIYDKRLVASRVLIPKCLPPFFGIEPHENSVHLTSASDHDVGYSAYHKGDAELW